MCNSNVVIFNQGNPLTLKKKNRIQWMTFIIMMENKKPRKRDEVQDLVRGRGFEPPSTCTGLDEHPPFLTLRKLLVGQIYSADV